MFACDEPARVTNWAPGALNNILCLAPAAELHWCVSSRPAGGVCTQLKGVSGFSLAPVAARNHRFLIRPDTPDCGLAITRSAVIDHWPYDVSNANAQKYCTCAQDTTFAEPTCSHQLILALFLADYGASRFACHFQARAPASLLRTQLARSPAMKRSSEEMRKQRDRSTLERVRVVARCLCAAANPIGCCAEGRKWLICALAANPGHLRVIRRHRSELLPEQEDSSQKEIQAERLPQPLLVGHDRVWQSDTVWCK